MKYGSFTNLEQDLPRCVNKFTCFDNMKPSHQLEISGHKIREDLYFHKAQHKAGQEVTEVNRRIGKWLRVGI